MPGGRILIVDDDVQILGLYMKVLVGRGYTVTGTTSSTDAIAAAFDAPFDVAVVDLSMPGVDGLEVLKTLRQECPEIKILMMSGAMQGVLLNSAGVFGASATLPKPASPEQLITTVESLLHPRMNAAGTGGPAPR